jgi:hypothetical protein
MKGRIDAFEKLFMAGSMGVNPAPQYNQPFQYSQEYVDTPGPSPTGEPQGMIPIPENIRRLQVNQQQAFAVPQEPYHQQRQQAIGPNRWQNGGGYFGRLMVGSLAGLMIMEGFREAERDSETPGARGLFAIPTQLLRTFSQAAHSSLDVSVLGYHLPAAQTLGYMKMLLVVGALLYVFLPSLFASKLDGKDGRTQNASLSAAPSLASSIQVRRQAWLTAVQTV